MGMNKRTLFDLIDRILPIILLITGILLMFSDALGWRVTGLALTTVMGVVLLLPPTLHWFASHSDVTGIGLDGEDADARENDHMVR